jgi:hypothetical protein
VHRMAQKLLDTRSSKFREVCEVAFAPSCMLIIIHEVFGILRRNEFIVNILEGAISGKKRPWEDLEYSS